MQKWGEERIFPHPNIYYRTKIKAPVSVSFPMEGGCVFLWNILRGKEAKGMEESAIHGIINCNFMSPEGPYGHLHKLPSSVLL